MQFDFSTRQGKDAIARHLQSVAVASGLCSEYYAKITWANESGSVYLSLPGHKIRVGDHGACYGCSISVDPEGLTVEQAEAWIRQTAEDEAEEA